MNVGRGSRNLDDEIGDLAMIARVDVKLAALKAAREARG